MNSSARSRILDAALSCFASKGYEATTIIDIERAAGLSPGSGATYKHFKSKREMLDEAITALQEHRASFMTTVSTSAVETAKDAIELGRHNADLFRILFRDLAQFPELREQVLAGLVEGVYRVAAERTAEVIPQADTDAIAVVMCNATLGFTLLESVLGVTPLAVDVDRFANVWARMVELLIVDELATAEVDEQLGG